MTINGAGFNPMSANAAIGAGAAVRNSKTAGNALSSALGTARSDKLDLSRFGQKFLEASDADKAQVLQMIRDANEMYGYSKFEKASESYWELRKMINDEIEHSENDIKGVEKYQKELKYYKDILAKTNGDKIYIPSDKYGWISSSMGSKFHNGSYISRSELEEAISKAEARTYDKYIGRYTDDVDPEDYNKRVLEEGESGSEEDTQNLAEELGILPEDLEFADPENKYLGNWGNILSRKFEKYANIFSSVTGEKVLHQGDGESNPMFSREGLTLDNFIEKTNERIDMLEDCEKELKKSMEKYIAGLKPEDLEQSSENFLDIKLELFFRKQEALSEILDDFDKNNEQMTEIAEN